MGTLLKVGVSIDFVVSGGGAGGGSVRRSECSKRRFPFCAQRPALFLMFVILMSKAILN